MESTLSRLQTQSRRQLFEKVIKNTIIIEEIITKTITEKLKQKNLEN